MRLTQSLYKAWAQRVSPLCLCAVLGLAFLPTNANAQSNDVANRLKRMENDIQTLNRAVYKGEKPPAGASAEAGANAAADLEVRMGQIETDLRNLTGKVEQQTYDTQQLQQKLDALSESTRMRLDTMEGQKQGAQGAAATQGQVDPALVQQQPPIQPGLSSTDTAAQPPMGGTPAAQPPADGPEQTVEISGAGAIDAAGLYEQGFGEIKREDYPAAEKSFAKFMKTYPDHALAPNALYWLGETYYVRKDYDKASRVFAEAYQKYPGGPKGADNLLKLGMSLAGKGEKQNACIALGQLKKEYPKGPAPILKRAEQEMVTAGCT